MAAPGIARLAKFGDFVADFDSFELRKHGIRLKLQHQPFQILKLLLQRPGQLVTREEFRMELWTESTFVDFDSGLNAAVRRLRDALSDFADEPRYIETLPRLGYRFIAPVEIAAASPSQAITSPTTSGDGEAEQGVALLGGPVSAESGSVLTIERPKAWRVLGPWRLFAACLLVVAVGMGAVALRSRVLAKRSGDSRVYSIAVLPLKNLSGDPSQDYFADGMTDALITNLAQSVSLNVISSTSSMRYKGTQKPLPEIGRELNVGLIVEGSVIRSGNQVRVTAQLLDAAKDQHLWARHYDRDLKDVLLLQSELAKAVALEVAGRLTPSEESRLKAEVRPVNPQAYVAYLKGEYFLNKWSTEGFNKAKDFFEQSIDLDPNYAQGFSGLAEYYGLAAYTGFVPPRDAWLKSEDLLVKSLEIDSNLSDAHALLGMLKLQFRCDRAAAEKELNRALELNPNDMRALDYHSFYLLETGSTDDAIAEKQRVLKHDPVSLITNAELGLYFVLAGRPDEAIVQLEKTLELDLNYPPAHMRLGRAYEMKAQYDQAAVEMQKAISLGKEPPRMVILGELYARWGKRPEALRTIRELRDMSKHRYVAPTGIALIYAQLGEKESALAWLMKANGDDDPKVTDTGFDGLRSDPQFKALEARLKPGPACPPF
jgi:TolB-like protein/DNA-binding winged helix-turn-helix (wHTH) protein/Flp pilus assembly protein TadD